MTEHNLPDMYGWSDDPDEPGQDQTLPAPVVDGRTTRITIGAIAYEVPSVAYVRQLELALSKQDAALQRLMREIIVLRQSMKRAAKPSDVEELRREMRDVGL